MSGTPGTDVCYLCHQPLPPANGRYQTVIIDRIDGRVTAHYLVCLDANACLERQMPWVRYLEVNV